MRCCVYPGSFDPFTLGHWDIAHRARNLFDKVVILISTNSGKGRRLVTEKKMKRAIEATLLGAELVEGKEYDVSQIGFKVDILPNGQTVIDYMSNHRKELDNCTNIIRGIRNAEDAVAEIDLAGCYRYFSHDIRFEFIPLLASDKYRYVSSTLVKEMYRVNNEHPMPEFNEKVPLSAPVRQVCDEAYPAKVFGDTLAHLAMPWM